MHELTERQESVYTFIADYLRMRGYAPTMREIAGHLNITGNLGVMRHLAALEKKGYITRTSGNSRSIRLIRPESYYPGHSECPPDDTEERCALFLPVVGTVRAGMPQAPLEDIQEYHSIDRSAARTGGAFFLRVKGDSMINAAIQEGDLALIRPQQIVQHRDLVVALVDGEATLKRFYREADHIRLQPENPNYEPIIIRQGATDISIVGKVVGIYRTLE